MLHNFQYNKKIIYKKEDEGEGFANYSILITAIDNQSCIVLREEMKEGLFREQEWKKWTRAV